MKNVKMLLVALLAVLVTGGLTAMVSAPATAKATPKITLTPHKNVKNGATITVKGTGYNGIPTVYIAECSKTTGAGKFCNQTKLVILHPTKAGKFTATFKVFTGTTGKGKCKAGGACYLGASDITLAHSASKKFTFKK